MELELGLKITQTRDDLSPTADLRISKDAGGILFFSRETEAMFVLTGHLRGYRRKHIDIRINEDGTRISISGEKPVQEKVIQGWIVYKKEVELKGFTKVFCIPQGVVLDKIKGKFNEDGSVLTISMPKSVKGISGEGIEEVKEAVDGGMEGSGLSNEADGMMEREREERDALEETSTRRVEDRPKTDQETSWTKFKESDYEMPEREGRDVKQEEKTVQQRSAEPLEAAAAADQITEHSEPVQEDTAREEGAQENEEASELTDEERTRDPGKDDSPRQAGWRKMCKIYAPAVAGSALLMSLIVLVINLKKTKQREM